jgi:hypothetical protein
MAATLSAQAIRNKSNDRQDRTEGRMSTTMEVILNE